MVPTFGFLRAAARLPPRRAAAKVRRESLNFASLGARREALGSGSHASPRPSRSASWRPGLELVGQVVRRVDHAVAVVVRVAGVAELVAVAVALVLVRVERAVVGAVGHGVVVVVGVLDVLAAVAVGVGGGADDVARATVGRVRQAVVVVVGVFDVLAAVGVVVNGRGDAIAERAPASAVSGWPSSSSSASQTFPVPSNPWFSWPTFAVSGQLSLALHTTSPSGSTHVAFDHALMPYSRRVRPPGVELLSSLIVNDHVLPRFLPLKTLSACSGLNDPLNGGEPAVISDAAESSKKVLT